MNVEQQFVDLIKEGKVADAIELIKTSLTEMGGTAIVDQKFSIAEKFGMKKKEKEESDDDDSEESDDDDDSEDSDDDEDEDEMKKAKK
jgi:hypothetical protein